MLSPTFSARLSCRVEPGRACIGRFDGERALLAVGSSGNKVLLHSSDELGKSGTLRPRYLNMTGEVATLACGAFGEGQRDVLLVGGPSSLLAYDVHDNCDRFFVEVPEGVRCVRMGRLHKQEDPLVFVGGNCALQGFDADGQEQYWTVIGGNASSLAFCDLDSDGGPELLVGSDDFEIRAFQSEESMIEVTETESVLQLCALSASGSRFAYGLQNGTIGVYDGETRVWRVKAKDHVNCMVFFDLNGDGVEELVTGWSNGKLEARRNEDGQVVYRETLSSPVTALLRGDFRNTGQDELICLTLDGQVRGYACASSQRELVPLGAAVGGTGREGFEAAEGITAVPSSPQSPQYQVMQAIAFNGGGPENDEEAKMRECQAGFGPASPTADPQDDAAARREAEADAAAAFALAEAERAKHNQGMHEPRDAELAALQEKLTLRLMELRSLEEAIANAKSGSEERPLGAIPKDTQVSLALRSNAAAGCLELTAETNNACVIHSVLVFAFDAGVFDSECIIHVSGSNLASSLVVPLRVRKNLATDLRVQTFVSARGSAELMHVFEDDVPLCSFPAFCSCPSLSEDLGSATFSLAGQSLESLTDALRTMFSDQALPPGGLIDHERHELRLCLEHVEGAHQVEVQAREEGDKTVHVQLRCDSLELASQIVQELVVQLGIGQLESSVDFPPEMRRLEALMEQVQELNSIRQRFGAELADESHYIKSLIVKAEDARMLGDITNLTQRYQELTSLNLQLVGEYSKRANNQRQLLDSLKQVNQIIQWASRLRAGKPQTAMIAACRKAIKTTNLPALFHALTSYGT